MTKNCTQEHPCEHRTLGGTFFGCNYFGYCDFQLPRDSRNQPPPNHCSCGTSAVCPMHHGIKQD